MVEAFTDEWARAWCSVLNRSDKYRETAAQWEGSVALVVDGKGNGQAKAVFLDLHRGGCREARVASADDLADAAYVFEAEPPTWRQLLSGNGSPVMALMTGQLRLTRGDLSQLLPYASAARELIGLAKEVDTIFADSW